MFEISIEVVGFCKINRYYMLSIIIWTRMTILKDFKIFIAYIMASIQILTYGLKVQKSLIKKNQNTRFSFYFMHRKLISFQNNHKIASRGEAPK